MNLNITKVPFKPHPENGWYITITFQITDIKLIDRIDEYTDEWVYIHDTIYPNEIWEQGPLSILNRNKRIDNTDLRIHNPNPLLVKLSKDTYKYYCPVTNRGVTRGTLEDIEELSKLTEWEEYDYLLLIKYLKTLDDYWD